MATTLDPLIADGYSIVVVDDGSSDNTWNVLQNLPVYALRHPINLGQGAALQTGAEFALSHGAGYIVHFDADGQHNADDIPTLLAPLVQGKADIALGSRFLHCDVANRVPWKRRMMLRTATWVNWLFTGLRLSDVHNGFRAMAAGTARQIVVRENRSAHALEILALINRRHLRYIECPTTIIYTAYSRAKGQKGISAFNILFDLLMRRFVR